MNTNQTLSLAHMLATNHIGSGAMLNTPELYSIAKQHFEGSQASGAYDRLDTYNALELAFNIKILRAAHDEGLFATDCEMYDAAENYGLLRKWLYNLPTHSVRSDEQVQFQQFSTPPHLAYLAAWVANIQGGEKMLEPSAGLGALATFGLINDTELVVNEIAPERHALLDAYLGGMEYATLLEPTDASHLRAFHPTLRPTLVVMNPPFSSNGSTGYKNKFIGLDHVKQALSMLQTGGRVVAILYGGRPGFVGDKNGASMHNPEYFQEWDLLKSKFTIRCNVGLPGKEYQKYGTGVDTRLIVIDKVGPQNGAEIIACNFTDNTMIENNFFDMMEQVRQVRFSPSVWPAELKQVAAANPERIILGKMPKPDEYISGEGKGPNIRINYIDMEAERQKYAEQDRLRAEQEASRPVLQKVQTVSYGPEEGLVITKHQEQLGPDTVEELVEWADDKLEVEELPVVELPKELPALDEIEVVEAEEVEKQENSLLNVFQGYKPFLTLTGAKPHPSPLVESDTLRLVKPPKPKAKVRLPFEAVQLGRISDVQVETVALAINSASRIIPGTQTRRSFIAGQGTGFGKGTTLAAGIMHFWLSGARRILWTSKTSALLKDGRRDWTFIGGDADDIFLLNDEKGAITRDGILFGTYSTIAMEQTATEAVDGLEDREQIKGIDRLEQIKAWKPQLIIYDEAHMMANSIGKDAAKSATRGIELMEAFPDVPVIMASATAATEVRNLAYATDRLGLCGSDMGAFPDKIAFIEKIGGAGMLAMELVAKDMKTMGLYMSQNLSYEGTSFRMLEHKLTDDQVDQYNTACEAWRMAIAAMEEQLEENNASDSAAAQRLIKSQFYGAMQRFFNQLLTSMKTPTTIKDMELAIATGHSCVVQLVNTNEAATGRAVAEALQKGQSLDEMDISPKDTLIQLIMSVYPTVIYETIVDERGNEKCVPVKDYNGNLVSNPDALQNRADLIRRVSDLRIPESAMDMIINHFGFDMVAEVTGRKERYVTRRARGEVGLGTKVRQSRTKITCEKESEEFNNGTRKILIFSGAGNTGRSFHADRRFKNQDRRMHYVLQPGWRADEALQGLGRTHRTNQSSAPEYVLPTTNLKGEKRFITSIARRIEQLGSLTKGNRKAASGGLFSADDNLETPYATMATYNFFMALKQNMVEGLDLETVVRQMGLQNIIGEGGLIVKDKLPKTTQLLNRLLCLNCDVQDKVFDAWFSFIQDLIDKAVANGTFDKGVEKINAERVTKLSEVDVYTDKETGAVSRIVELQVMNRTRYVSLEEALRGRYVSDTLEGYSHVNGEELYTFVKHTVKAGANIGEERVYVVLNSRWTNDKDGNIVKAFRKISPFGAVRLAEADYMAEENVRISQDTAEAMWKKAIDQAREYESEDVYLLTGALLPIWDKIPTNAKEETRIIAAETDEKERLLGRVIPADDLHQLFINLGALKQGEYFTAEQLIGFVMDHDARLVLANNWKVQKRRTAGEDRLIVTGISSAAAKGLETDGHLKYEWIGSNLYYIPLDGNELEHFAALTASRPVVQMDKQGYLINVLAEPPQEEKKVEAYVQEADTYSIDHLVELHDLKTKQIRPVSDLLLEVPVEVKVEVAKAPDLFTQKPERFELELPDPNLIPTPSLPEAKPKVEVKPKVETTEEKLQRMVEKAAYEHANNPKPKKVAAMEAAGQMSLF